MAKDVVAVHHADRRRDVVMPYAPALLVRRGSLVFRSGVTAAPVFIPSTLSRLLGADR